MSRPRLWPATIGPAAAYVIDREVGRQLEQKAHAMKSAQPAVADELLAAVGMMRDTGRRWFEVVVDVNGTACQAVSGTTEVPQRPDRPQSGAPPEIHGGVVVARAAERLQVSERQVLNLIADKVLLAGRGPGRGRPWVIDEVSVAMEQRRRGVTP